MSHPNLWNVLESTSSSQILSHWIVTAFLDFFFVVYKIRKKMCKMQSALRNVSSEFSLTMTQNFIKYCFFINIKKYFFRWNVCCFKRTPLICLYAKTGEFIRFNAQQRMIPRDEFVLWSHLKENSFSCQSENMISILTSAARFNGKFGDEYRLLVGIRKHRVSNLLNGKLYWTFGREVFVYF